MEGFYRDKGVGQGSHKQRNNYFRQEQLPLGEEQEVSHADQLMQTGNSVVLGLLLGNVETAVKLDIKFQFVDVGLSTSDSIWACCLFLFFFFFFDTVLFFYPFLFLMKNVYSGLLNITIQETDLGKT